MIFRIPELEAAIGLEPMNRGFADLRLSHLATPPAVLEQKNQSQETLILCTGAGDEARTRDIHLGKVVLYQLSYSR